MLWCARSHHNETNGCKLGHIGNKNNLLCMNGYTYVVMLIVNKTSWKPLEYFCGLVKRTIFYVWMGTHICNNIDSGQDMKKTQYNNFVFHEFYWLFELPKNKNWGYNLIRDISWNVSTPLVLIPPIIPFWNKKLDNYVEFTFIFVEFFYPTRGIILLFFLDDLKVFK